MPNEVGYSIPILPATFTASNRRQLQDFVPMAAVKRAGIGRHATYVYKALMAGRGIVALKVAPQSDVQREVSVPRTCLTQWLLHVDFLALTRHLYFPVRCCG